MEDVIKNLDINGIREYHNCEYPLLMLDYVEEVSPGECAKGYKCFTYNEWFFPAHFADDPNVPSSMMMEALSQMLLMTILTLPGNKKRHTACLKINNVEFKRKVIPGERLDIRADVKKSLGGMYIGYTEGTVSGELAVKADYVIGIPEDIRRMSPNKH